MLAGAAEAALTSGIGRNGGIERGAIEIRPQEIGEVQLRVGKLPQQEIGDALLAARAALGEDLAVDACSAESVSLLAKTAP